MSANHPAGIELSQDVERITRCECGPCGEEEQIRPFEGVKILAKGGKRRDPVQDQHGAVSQRFLYAEHKADDNQQLDDADEIHRNGLFAEEDLYDQIRIAKDDLSTLPPSRWAMLRYASVKPSSHQGRAAALPIPGLTEAGYFTNETIFTLTELPRRLAVIGAGPIEGTLQSCVELLGKGNYRGSKNKKGGLMEAEISYATAPVPVRTDLLAAHRRVWQRLARAGN